MQCSSWIQLLVWCISKRMPNTPSQVKTSIRKLNQKAFKLLGFSRVGVLQLPIVSLSGSSCRWSLNWSRQASSHAVSSIALDVLRSASFMNSKTCKIWARSQIKKATTSPSSESVWVGSLLLEQKARRTHPLIEHIVSEASLLERSPCVQTLEALPVPASYIKPSAVPQPASLVPQLCKSVLSLQCTTCKVSAPKKYSMKFICSSCQRNLDQPASYS